MATPSNTAAWRHLVIIACLFALCTLFAGLSTLQSYVCEVSPRQQGLLGSLLRQEFKDWYACGIVSLGVIWFSGRNRPHPKITRRWVAIHCAASLAFAGIYAVLTSWLVAGERSVMRPGKTLTFSYLMGMYWAHYMVVYLLMYWFVVFGHLAWDYYHRYQEREVQTVELQRQLVEARLEALRMQLNLHFLFNTLHAVSALIHQNPEAADRVVARLSELLRLSLDQCKPQEVTLNEALFQKRQ